MKTVTSKSGNKYRKTAGGAWELIRVGANRKPKKFTPHHRRDVIDARVRLIAKAGGDRKKIAALLKRFKNADR